MHTSTSRRDACKHSVVCVNNILTLLDIVLTKQLADIHMRDVDRTCLNRNDSATLVV